MSPTAKCDLCWAEFPTAEELAKHVEMEESVDWPVTISDGGGAGVQRCPTPVVPAGCDKNPDDRPIGPEGAS